MSIECDTQIYMLGFNMTIPTGEQKEKMQTVKTLGLWRGCVILTSMEETNLLRKMTWMHPTVSETAVSTLDMSK